MSGNSRDIELDALGMDPREFPFLDVDVDVDDYIARVNGTFVDETMIQPQPQQAVPVLQQNPYLNDMADNNNNSSNNNNNNSSAFASQISHAPVNTMLPPFSLGAHDNSLPNDNSAWARHFNAQVVSVAQPLLEPPLQPLLEPPLLLGALHHVPGDTDAPQPKRTKRECQHGRDKHKCKDCGTGEAAIPRTSCASICALTSWCFQDIVNTAGGRKSAKTAAQVRRQFLEIVVHLSAL
jgi:hypothetical protein